MRGYFAALAAMLMLFGCASAPEDGSAKEMSGGPSVETGDADEPVETGVGPASGSESGSTDVAGKTMAQLVDLGVPVNCKIRVRSEAGTSEATLYLKGESFRIETVVNTEGETYEALAILRGGRYYVAIPEDQKQYMNGCDWIMGESAEGVESSDMSIQDIKGIPESDYTCTPGVFGNEKFETPGKACTFEDIMMGMG
jgi:hypothetical protein